MFTQMEHKIEKFFIAIPRMQRSANQDISLFTTSLLMKSLDTNFFHVSF